MEDQHGAVIRDKLARQRTELANERTLLSYMRTALGLIAVGVPAVWWFTDFPIRALGVASLLLGVLLIGIGVYRFFLVKAEIDAQS